jgi:hypothetical protein
MTSPPTFSALGLRAMPNTEDTRLNDERLHQLAFKGTSSMWVSITDFERRALVAEVVELRALCEELKEETDEQDAAVEILTRQLSLAVSDNDYLRRTLDDICAEVSKVYYHVTDGKISKPNTVAFDVIAVSDEYTMELCDEACKEEAERCDNMQRLLTQRTREVVAAENHVQALLKWFDHPLTVGEAAEHIDESPSGARMVGGSHGG